MISPPANRSQKREQGYSSDVRSLDALKDLKGLTTLTLLLSYSKLVDLSSLQSCEKLETLNITHRLRYEFDALPKSLRSLHLSDAGPK
jgi:hypothetical protein